MAAVVKGLSSADQQLSYSQQKQIAKAKDAYNAAKAAGDTVGMEKAHADAEAIRISEGYYGGASGTGNTKTTGWKYTGGKLDTSSLSADDQKNLSKDEQKKILSLKAAYDVATDDSEKAYINSLANSIRANYGYSGGTTGSQFARLAYGQGGKSADDIKSELDAYKQKWYNPTRGWTNGYSTGMNTRSKANLIRQQMHANEQAMNDTNRAELQGQNEALAQLLYDYTGQKNTTTYWNADKNRWETWNPDVGYGYDVSGTQPNIRNALKQYGGYTDEDIERYANDTSRYYNFVDTARNRLTTDESSGYTGQYAQFVNGPYAELVWGTKGWQNKNVPWEDTIGDGFHDEEDYNLMTKLKYDENGNVIKTEPYLKNNNSLSEYSAQFAPVAASGVLGGRAANGSVMHPSGDTNFAGQRDYYINYGSNASSGGLGSSGLSGGSYENYINQMYDAALQSQLAALESSYQQNVSELDANIGKTKDTYTEQKRQTTGTNAQEAANWRELANAYGMNTGTLGQAALAQSNQLQSNLNSLEQAEAAALTEIDRQKALLGQQYQLQINQALSENNFNKAQALYQEAVRAEEALTQKQQYASQLALQYAQLAQSNARTSTTGGSGDTGDYIPVPEPDPGDDGDDFVPIDSEDALTPAAYSKYKSWIPYYAKTSDRVKIGLDIANALESGSITYADGLFMLQQFGIDPTLYGYTP